MKVTCRLGVQELWDTQHNCTYAIILDVSMSRLKAQETAFILDEHVLVCRHLKHEDCGVFWVKDLEVQ